MRTRILSTLVTALVLSWQATAAAQTDADLEAACNNYSTNYVVTPPECTWEVNFGAHTAFPNVCGTPMTWDGANWKGVCVENNDGTPCITDMECYDSMSGIGWCDNAVRVELSYPTEPNPGVTYAPAVFMHGGGTDPGYRDIHEQAYSPDKNPNDYPSHPINPYQGIVRRLVAKGMVVIQPIFPSQAAPQIMAKKAAKAVNCMMERLDSTTCGADRPCFVNLVDRVGWKFADKSHIVYIGHSSAGVASLYVPAELGYALRGIIMIDPAKDDGWVSNPPTAVHTDTPVVHFYPDYYGPLAKVATPNSLLNLGTHPALTGPWVPIGIRDYPGCNPDTGCHEAHHCTSLGNDMTHETASNTHGLCGAYCGSGVKFCSESAPTYVGLPCTTDANCGGVAGSCITCTKTISPACPAGTVCSQAHKCRNNTALKPAGHVWKHHRTDGVGATSTTILARYVISWAGCLGAIKGDKLQPWVTGRQRDFDDLGFGGEPSDPLACTKNGIPDSFCAQWTNKPFCEVSGCFWAKNAERVCNGGTNVNLPCSGDPDCPGAVCGVQRCFGGTNWGAPCTSSANCPGGSCKGTGSVIRLHSSEVRRDYTTSDPTQRWMASPQTEVPWEFNVAGPGSFKERQERINWFEGQPQFIKCQSGPATW